MRQALWLARSSQAREKHAEKKKNHGDKETSIITAISKGALL